MTILDGLREFFSLGELKTLCFDLGFDWENFGNTKFDISDGLIRYYKHASSYDRNMFAQRLSDLREHVNWEKYRW